MTELINSLKTFAYSGSMAYDRRHSSGQLRMIPLLNLGGSRTESAADSSFSQWRDAMRMVARLPGGLPVEFRLKLWENLSEKYLRENGIRWSTVLTKSAQATARDSEIADQIHKDLHRTGCTGFSSSAKQAKLKSVLVAYGRWNPSVGYCQGFNMIGAMLLEMTLGDETLTLKVLIFLIEGVLPQGYFSGGLRGLAVDMAVFREILRVRKPTLHAQLVRLQGGEEQPPLIDVFTMHWFLTLFIHCLPNPAVLRIWDLVLLEGSEVLLRTALVLWAAIEGKILEVGSADEFYSVMGVVTREMLETGLMDANSLVKCIVSVDPFPFPGLIELRQKHRALVQQDTPYKSFFLAKRELDNLKRHYAAIRHRQKATTIIMKGLEASRIRVPGQRSNSLFIPSTQTQLLQNKKIPNQSNKPKLRRGSSGSSNKINTNTNAPPQNNNNIGKGRNVHQHNNNMVNRGQCQGAGGGQQKNLNNGNHPSFKTSKSSSTAASSFRRRRTLSQSSIATSSSSSTELCDSDDAGNSSSSEGVWSDSDNKWVTKSQRKKSKSPTKRIKPTRSISGEFEIVKMKAELEVPLLGESNLQKSPSIIDTNDSQHFLAEMTKLGKSDSFYENLSKRICELQFQNVKTLNSCTTVIDPSTLALPPFPKSPLQSPSTPRPFSPNLRHSSSSLSPRESIEQQNTFTMSPSSPFDLSTKSLKGSSVSSLEHVEIPDICVLDPDTPYVPPSSSYIPELELEIMEKDLQEKEKDTETSLEFPETASTKEELLSPLLTSPSSPQKNIESSNCLVSPKSPKLSPKKRHKSKSSNEGGSDNEEDVTYDKDASAFLYGNFGNEEGNPSLDSGDAFLFPTSRCPGQCDLELRFDSGRNRGHDFDLDFNFRKISTTSSGGGDDDDEYGEELPSSSEEERKINDVIRENIAILQRLKLNKTAFADDEDSYEDISDDPTEIEPTPSAASTEISSRPGPVGARARVIADVEPKERLSSVSSNNSSCSTSGFHSSGGRRKSSQGSRSQLSRQGSLQKGGQGQSQGAGGQGFNPFPTVRKARLRVTKYGLYN